MQRPPASLMLIRQLTGHKWHDAQDYVVKQGLRFFVVERMSGYEYILIQKDGRVWRVVRHNGTTHVYPSD